MLNGIRRKDWSIYLTYLDILTPYHSFPKTRIRPFHYLEMYLKTANSRWLANIEDPDQTPPLILVYTIFNPYPAIEGKAWQLYPCNQMVLGIKSMYGTYLIKPTERGSPNIVLLYCFGMMVRCMQTLGHVMQYHFMLYFQMRLLIQSSFRGLYFNFAETAFSQLLGWYILERGACKTLMNICNELFPEFLAAKRLLRSNTHIYTHAHTYAHTQFKIAEVSKFSEHL